MRASQDSLEVSSISTHHHTVHCYSCLRMIVVETLRAQGLYSPGLNSTVSW